MIGYCVIDYFTLNQASALHEVLSLTSEVLRLVHHGGLGWHEGSLSVLRELSSTSIHYPVSIVDYQLD